MLAINVEGVIESEKFLNFVVTKEIVESGKDHQ